MKRFIELLRSLDVAKIILVLALLVGAVIRINGWYDGAGVNTLSTSTDSVMYNTLATNLVDGNGYTGNDHMIARAGEPTVFYGPVFPLYLAFIYTLFGKHIPVVQFSHMALALLTVVLVYMLGARLFGRVTGAIAAFIFAASPNIVYYNFKVLSETLYIFIEVLVLIAMVALLQRDRPALRMLAGAGLLFGLAYLCRQTVIAVLFVFIPVFLARFRDIGLSYLWQSLAVFIGVALLVVSPWVVRNYLVFDQIIAGTTTGPTTLWWGTLEHKGTSLEDLIKDFRTKHSELNELEMSRVMSKEAKQNLAKMGAKEVFSIAWLRVRNLFGLPKSLSLDSQQLLKNGFPHALLGILGITGLCVGSRRRADRLMVVLFVVAVIGIHIATLGVFRYLMPVVPILAVGVANLLTLVLSYVRVGGVFAQEAA